MGWALQVANKHALGPWAGWRLQGGDIERNYYYKIGICPVSIMRV